MKRNKFLLVTFLGLGIAGTSILFQNCGKLNAVKFEKVKLSSEGQSNAVNPTLRVDSTKIDDFVNKPGLYVTKIKGQDNYFKISPKNRVLQDNLILGSLQDFSAMIKKTLPETRSEKLSSASLVQSKVGLWPNGIIRYRFDLALSPQKVAFIEEGLAEWRKKVKSPVWVEDKNAASKDSILFKNADPLECPNLCTHSGYINAPNSPQFGFGLSNFIEMNESFFQLKLAFQKRGLLSALATTAGLVREQNHPDFKKFLNLKESMLTRDGLAYMNLILTPLTLLGTPDLTYSYNPYSITHCDPTCYNGKCTSGFSDNDILFEKTALGQQIDFSKMATGEITPDDVKNLEMLYSGQKAATLSITSNVFGTEIFYDGKLYGKTPLLISPAEFFGNHKYTAKATGYMEKSIDVMGVGVPQSLAFELVSLNTKKPDLFVSSLVRSGENFVFEVKNNGTATFGPGTFSIGIMIKDDGVGSIKDELILSQAISIAPGQIFGLQLTAKGIKGSPGGAALNLNSELKFSFMADNKNEVDETDESNNTTDFSVTKTATQMPPPNDSKLADLIILNIERSSQKVFFLNDETIKISVQNIGKVSTKGNTDGNINFVFYASDVSGRTVAGRKLLSTPAIEPGQTQEFILPMVELKYNKFFEEWSELSVQISLDPGGEIVEANKFNNSLEKTFAASIGPETYYSMSEAVGDPNKAGSRSMDCSKPARISSLEVWGTNFTNGIEGLVISCSDGKVLTAGESRGTSGKIDLKGGKLKVYGVSSTVGIFRYGATDYQVIGVLGFTDETGRSSSFGITSPSVKEQYQGCPGEGYFMTGVTVVDNGAKLDQIKLLCRNR